MRRLPRSVRILTQKVDVERVAHIDLGDMDGHEEGDAAYGVYDADQPRIIISDGQGPDRQKHTFMHENLHLMFDIARLCGPEEEEIVGKLAPIMLSWLRENRGTVAFLQERS